MNWKLVPAGVWYGSAALLTLGAMHYVFRKKLAPSPTLDEIITGKSLSSKFSAGRRDPVRAIVIHTMEAPKSEGRAKQVAQWFASTDSPEVSSHYTVDDNEVWQVVDDDNVAWHASQANGYSIGIEHAGYAGQTPEEWDDAYNQAMLQRSAYLVAALAKKYGIPAVWLTPEELLAGQAGIVGHNDVTSAYSPGRGHWDPGPNFPKQKYIDLVKEAM